MTEHQNMEESWKECEEKFSKAFEESPLILALTCARDHRYIDVNDTFERTSGGTGMKSSVELLSTSESGSIQAKELTS